MSTSFFSHHIFLNIEEDVLYNNGNITAYVRTSAFALDRQHKGELSWDRSGIGQDKLLSSMTSREQGCVKSIKKF